MARLRQNMLLLAANLLIPVAVLLFMTGYFRPRTRARSLVGNGIGEIDTREAPFDKVVFMVIDALRSDFVYAENSSFTFTQSLIRSGAAIPFTALAAPPTLTISRLKALTQGSSQSFLDAFLNVVNSPDAVRLDGEDTWLSRLKTAKQSEKKLVYHGIDVWVDLYPDIFDSYEVFPCFYLPGLGAVDESITRRLPDQLQADDWTALVLHYIGLDSIAHLGGLRSAHMQPKQMDMDNVVQLIYEAIEEKPHLKTTLFVLLGDHGMTEQGNHGGDSPGEIASAMTFISPRFTSISKDLESPLPATGNYEYYSTINQVDLVPTLAGLLGFAIPARNVGIFIPKFLELFNGTEDAIQLLLQNAKQMMKVFELEYGGTTLDTTLCDSNCTGCDTESRIACLWNKVILTEQKSKISENAISDELTRSIRAFCDSVQQLLSVPPSNLGFRRLWGGIACLGFSTFLLVMSYSSSTAPSASSSLVFWIIIALHFGSMYIGQLVKEEHYYWYLTSFTWLAYLGFKKMGEGDHWLKAIWPAALQLLGQHLNPDGTQSPIAAYIDNLLSNNNPIFLWVLGSITYFSAMNTISKSLGIGSPLSLAVSCALCFGAMVFKLCSTSNFNPELLSFAPPWLEGIMARTDSDYIFRIFETCLVAVFIRFLVQLRVSRHEGRMATMLRILELVNLYLRCQARPKNLVLFHIFDLQLQWLLAHGNALNPSEITVISLLLAQSSFYALGRNNSIASLDMLNGYNGLDQSGVVPIVLQTLVSNWIGPVWWSLASLRMLLTWLEAQEDSSFASKRNKAFPGRRAFFEHITLQTIFTVSSSMAVMLACIWMRDDPALWTVLAPKYVNVALWAIFHHVLINVGLCTSLWVVIVG